MRLLIKAPIAGWATSLDEVPDPVFSTGMMGKGVAIDPTGELVHAPCDGLVTRISSTAHAVTITADNGAELLIHIGLETVALEGRGFTVLVDQGQRVTAGEELLRIDLDYLARNAPDLVSPVILANSERFQVQRCWSGQVVQVGDPLMEIMEKMESGSTQHSPPGDPRTNHDRRVPVHFEHGLHARPAARVAACARGFDADIRIEVRNQSANAKSAVAVMGLAIRQHETVLLRAAGHEARAALDALTALIGGEVPAEKTSAQQPSIARLCDENTRLTGARMAPGLAVGAAFRLQTIEAQIPEYGQGIEVERDALRQAVTNAIHRLETGQQDASTQRELLDAHRELLADPELEALAQIEINQGKSAAYAWQKATTYYRDILQNCGDSRIAQRADDLLDVERQVLDCLLGSELRIPPIPAGSIILADSLVPTQMLRLSDAAVAGICTVSGGTTSHVAILAQEMGIPAIAGMGEALMAVDEGTMLIVDADQGSLWINPDEEALARARDSLRTQQQQREQALHDALRPARLKDGTAIDVFANLGADAVSATDRGAEGCGLLRTEFLFEHRSAAPTLEEQVAAYQAIANSFGGRPVVIRTLDVGGDKSVPYLPCGEAENPALGPRGIRIHATHPEVLETQLRAIASVTPRGTSQVLLPMVSAVEEVIAVRDLIASFDADSGAASLPLGVMIETPAAAVIADHLLRHVDFLAVGSNDLTQYALAMDRGDSALAAMMDSLHPAVLRLIADVCKHGIAAGKPVSICGAMAADPEAIPILIGMGVRRLSLVPASTPMVKQYVRKLTLSDCEHLAVRALALHTAAEIRSAAQAFNATLTARETPP